jgi:hypothetical protein
MYTRKISFVDEQHNKVSIDIRIKKGRFSMSGNMGGCSGQCYDSIVPANDSQVALLKIWDKWHLNDVKAGTPRQMQIIKDYKDGETSDKEKDGYHILSSYNRATGDMIGVHYDTVNNEINKWKKEIDALNLWYRDNPPTKSELHIAEISGTLPYYEATLAEYGKNYLEAMEALKATMLYDIDPRYGDGTLYEYGSSWLAVDLPEDIEEQVDNICDEIEEEEEERKGESVADWSDEKLLEYVNEHLSLFGNRDNELCVALIRIFDLCVNDFEDITINGNQCEVQGTEYLAGSDDEMDDEWDESLDHYIDECLMPEIRDENLKRYFDTEAWKSDAKHDGRGHSLNHYDGGEESTKVNGIWYYAYRQ